MWRIVVHHEVGVWPLGDRGVDPLEEVEELGCPMALVAFPDHGAGGNVERGEQGCRAIADVGMGAPLRNPRRHGQDRSEEHTSELQALMRRSYAVFCLKKTKQNTPS